MRASRQRRTRLVLGAVAAVAAASALAGCGGNGPGTGGSPGGAGSPSAPGSPSASAPGTAPTTGGTTGGTASGGSGGGGGGGSTSGGQGGAPGSIEPGKPSALPPASSADGSLSSVPWTLAGTQQGGRQLVLSTETTPCRSPVATSVSISGGTVTVGLLGRRPPAGAMCAQYIQQRFWLVTLDSPLGNRHLAHLALRN
jgi:hypothetical protein